MRDVLTKIETLPEAALPAVQRAWDDLQARRKSQLAIREQLNEELAALDLEVASSSGFSRWVGRVKEGTARRPGQPSPAAEPTDWMAVASERTRALFAQALRSLADDFDPRSPAT